MTKRCLARAKIRGPRLGAFFRDDCARLRDHLEMMRGMPKTVNTRGRRKPNWTEKSRTRRPGLRYWPREADTITFQEGLLNSRATGGGGQMRNAKAQRASSMGLTSGMQQQPRPHVRHAEIRTASAAPCSPRSRGTLARARPSSAPPDRRNTYRAGSNRFAEQLYEAALFFDQVIRKCRDTEALLTGAHEAKDVVDLEIGFARTGAVAAGFDQPVAVLQVRREVAVGQRDDAVGVRAPPASAACRSA